MAANWQVAFDRLAADEPAALELLALCAQLAPEPIPFTLFTAHSDALPGALATVVGNPLKFARLTRLLRNRSLAQVETDSVQLHRLVQVILRSRSNGAATGSELALIAVRLLRAAVPPNPRMNPATWPEWRQLLPHVLAATDPHRDLDQANEDVTWLLNQAGNYLHKRGEPVVALPIFQRAYELSCRVLSEDHPDTLNSAGDLTYVLWDLGQYEAARQLGEDTLTRLRRVLGEDHSDTLTSATDLAADLRGLGQYEAARQLDEDTLIRARRVLGEDHPDTLTSASHLAADLRALGQHEAAHQLDEDTENRRRASGN